MSIITTYLNDNAQTPLNRLVIYTVIHNYGNPWFLLYSFWRNRLKV